MRYTDEEHEKFERDYNARVKGLVEEAGGKQTLLFFTRRASPEHIEKKYGTGNFDKVIRLMTESVFGRDNNSSTRLKTYDAKDLSRVDAYVAWGGPGRNRLQRVIGKFVDLHNQTLDYQKEYDAMQRRVPNGSATSASSGGGSAAANPRP